MARQRRVQVPGGFHHITARGNNRDSLFFDDGDRRTFLSVLGEAAAQHRCFVHAFCLMTNHVHLVIEDERAELSKCLQKVNGRYAQRFNHRHQRTGHVFEGRFWNSLLDTDSYLTTAVEYVHRNPLDAGMVTRLADYRWSSYPVYLGHRRRPTFLTTSTILDTYGSDPELLRLRTELDPRDPHKDHALSQRHPDSVLGGDDFKKRMAAASDRLGMSDRAQADVGNRLAIAKVAQITADAFGEPEESLQLTVRGQHNGARSAAIHLAHIHVGWPFSAIGDFFNISSSAASMANRRFLDLVRSDADLADAVAEISARLSSARTEQVGV